MSLFNENEVIACGGDSNLITKVMYCNASDIVFNEDGSFIRIKRKYGKFKRPTWGTIEEKDLSNRTKD